MTDSIQGTRADCRTLAAAPGGAACFKRDNPRTGEPLPDTFPVSTWDDCDAALQAAARAAEVLRELPGEQLGEFLECFAQRIEQRADDLVACAHAGDRPADRAATARCRTAADHAPAAAGGSGGARRILATGHDRRGRQHPLVGSPRWDRWSCLARTIFRSRFGSVSGGDFAAAIAAGNPVIAKANSSHPATTQVVRRGSSGGRRADGAARRRRCSCSIG